MEARRRQTKRKACEAFAAVAGLCAAGSLDHIMHAVSTTGPGISAR